MKYRLLEFLACPNDRYFPLELKVKKATNFNEIVAGHLYCPSCGQIFLIKNGLPHLLPNYEIFQTDQEVIQAKQSEMETRNKQALSYDQLFFLKLLSKLEIPAVLSLLKPSEGDTILELGAGTGRLTQLIAQKAEVIAVDYSASSLKLGWSKIQGHPVHFVLADINHLPFKPNIFKKAVSCQVFEHIPAAVRQTALNQVYEVLSQNGSFTLTVYRDSWFWRLFGPKEGFHAGGIYYYRFGGQEFKEFLSTSFHVEHFISNLGLYLLAARATKK